MRQVFSSARLENVEGVAQLLRDAGIEVRITNGRSYKGRGRHVASYRDRESPRPAVWVVKSEDQTRARALLREAGLMESSRPGDAKLSFRSDVEAASTRTHAQRRAGRIKLALLGGIVIVGVMVFVRGGRIAPVADPATGAFDGSATATLTQVAVAVLQDQLGDIDTPVACLSVDGADAPREVRDLLRPARRQTIVPASHCQRVADEETGSVHPQSKQAATLVDVARFRPSGPDTGTVEYSAYHHRMYARYKTLEVRRVDGAWKVVRVLRHVAT